MANISNLGLSRPRPSFLSWSGWKIVREQPVAAGSAVVIALLLIAGIFADVISPYDPLKVNYTNMLAPPSMEHLAGTDAFGRDLLSRLIHGARSAMIIGTVSAVLGCSIGALLGATSAYFGGWTDTLIQQLVDIMLAFPLIVLAMVIVAVLGKNIVFGVDFSLILAIALPMIAPVARVIRASALAVVTQPYIDAARTGGFSHSRIIFRHVAPNLAAPFLIMVTVYISKAILLEASLSYLGLGVAEPTPSWGLMLSGNATDFFTVAPWLIVFPGAAISMAIISFSLLGDGLRDWLDPRLKT